MPLSAINKEVSKFLPLYCVNTLLLQTPVKFSLMKSFPMFGSSKNRWSQSGNHECCWTIRSQGSQIHRRRLDTRSSMQPCYCRPPEACHWYWRFKSVYDWTSSFCLTAASIEHISDGSALCAPLDEFGFITSAAQFRHPSAFTIPSVRAALQISGAVQDRANGPGDFALRHRFRATIQMWMGLCIIQGHSAELAARRQVLLLHECIIEVLPSLDLVLVSTSLLAPILSQVLSCRCRYYYFPATHWWQSSILIRSSQLCECVHKCLHSPIFRLSLILV